MIDAPEEMRQCLKCGEIKPTIAFSQKGSARNSHCKVCIRAYQEDYHAAHPEKRKEIQHRSYLKHHENNLAKRAEYRQENRTDLRNQKRERTARWKAERICKICGENHPACLDFHHRDPNTKSFDISHAISIGMSDELIGIEIAKCDVLCRNCHTKLHWERAEALLK